MKSYLTFLSVSNLICVIFCQIIENQPIASTKGDNLHLMSSTFQLQELLGKEIKMVQEIEKYVTLLREEIERVQNYLQKNYQSDDVLPKNEEGTFITLLNIHF